MRVKLKTKIPLTHIKEYNQTCSGLNKDKTYTVLGISNDDFRIINERGEPILYLAIFFDIVDNTIDKNWVIDISPYDEDRNIDTRLLMYLDPKEFQGFFYEDFFDYKREAIDIFLFYIEKHNIKVFANLEYAPFFKKEYYKRLLLEIDNGLI